MVQNNQKLAVYLIWKSTTTNQSRKSKSSIATILIYSLGLFVLLGCLFYLSNKIYVLEDKIVTLTNIKNMSRIGTTTTNNKQIDLISRALEKTTSASQYFTSIVIAIVGFFITILAVFILPLVTYFYKQIIEVYRAGSNMLNDVDDAQKKINSLMEVHATIQHELAKVNTIQFTSLEKKLEDVPSSELKEILSLLLISTQQVDSYRLCVSNSLSMDENLRRRSLQKLLTYQNIYPTAKDYILRLLNHFDGPKFEDDRNIILIGLRLRLR